MLEYGCVHGVMLYRDSVHDEVFVREEGLVVMANEVWLFSDSELYCILGKVKQGERLLNKR